MSAPRRPGMMEVARLAGVSHQTVSRVLNDQAGVRSETRERVLRAISELGYRRNLTARALVTRQSSLLGVIWMGAGFYGPSSTVAGIEVAARAAGWAALVAAVDDSADVLPALEGFAERGADALVVVAPQTGIADVLRPAIGAVPTVMVSDMGADPVFHTVSVDQRLGARMATGHLVERGARRIVHVSGPGDWFDARARLAGWRDALRAEGLSESPVVQGDWSAQSGYDCAKRVIRDDLGDAVFFGNDAMALGGLAAFRRAGIDVPGQVRVVGYDDIDGTAWSAPPLTTVRQPFGDLGALCMEVLLGASEGEPPGAHRIEPRLMVRRST